MVCVRPFDKLRTNGLGKGVAIGYMSMKGDNTMWSILFGAILILYSSVGLVDPAAREAAPQVLLFSPILAFLGLSLIFAGAARLLSPAKNHHGFM